MSSRPLEGVESTASHYPMKILVVDDHSMNRQLIGSMLSYFGYEYQEASNGKEAFECCQKSENDCILMDVNMPVIDGVEATRLIREWEKNQGFLGARIIVAITANAMIGDREKFLASGMDFYLPKPIRIKELRDTLGESFLKLSMGRPH